MGECTRQTHRNGAPRLAAKVTGAENHIWRTRGIVKRILECDPPRSSYCAARHARPRKSVRDLRQAHFYRSDILTTMPTNAGHHVCLRVSDIERATTFYINAFGARVTTLPFVIDGELAAEIMDGPKGVAFRVAMLGFDQGALELYEFIEPIEPTEYTHLTKRHVNHIAFQVDDVATAVSRVLNAGGRRVWPEIKSIDALEFTYVADPDNAVIELVNLPMSTVAERVLEAYPEARPTGASTSA